MRRWAFRLLWLIAAVALAVVLCDASQGMFWNGDTTLTIEFVVTDAKSGAPIEGAEIAVEGHDEERPDEKEFALVTGADGKANRVCPRVFTFGSRSRWGITSARYSVAPLKWEVSVSAPGSQP